MCNLGFHTSSCSLFYHRRCAIAVSSSGALKAKIESLGLSITVYRDRAPETTPLPYAVISEGIATVPDPLEDNVASTGKETVSIDIFQQWKDPVTGALTENRGLPDAIVRGIHGQGLPAAPTRAYAVLVKTTRRLAPEEPENLTHSNITGVIWRTL